MSAEKLEASRYAPALNGVVQLAGHHPARQKVACSVSSWGTCLGCRFGPRLGSVPEATDRCFSFTFRIDRGQEYRLKGRLLQERMSPSFTVQRENGKGQKESIH